MQTSGVRQANLRAVLTLVVLNPGLSAADLSRRSGLAPQTVSAILDDLEQAGLLSKGEVLRGRRGQPATPYFRNPEGAYAIGIEIGWRHIEAVLINLGGKVLGQYHRDYPFPDARTIFNELGSISRQLVDKLPQTDRHRLVGLGIATPGGIGRNMGLLEGDAEMGKLWHGVDIRAEVEKASGVPTQIYNDGNAACWAELSVHPAPRPTDFAYLHIGTFIGAGIVAQNTLWEGPTGNSANLGSMLVTDTHGDENFVHLLASVYAFEQRLRGAGITVPPTTPLFWPWDQWEPHVSDWIAEAAPALAKVLVNTEAVIEYPVAIIDGVVPSAVLDRLVAAVQSRVSEMPTLTFDAPIVEKGHLGNMAPAMGAAFLPIYRRFFSRDLTHMTTEAETGPLNSSS